MFVSFLVIGFSAAGEGPVSIAWRGGVLPFPQVKGSRVFPEQQIMVYI